MIDLHTHSTASDGELPPCALMEKAAKIGLKTIALTDHDTIAGLKEAHEAAKSHDLRFIPGIELEINTSINTSNPSINPSINNLRTVSGEFHLLGLGLKVFTDEFTQVLSQISGARERRNREMVRRMKAAGIKVEYKDIQALAGGTVIGRPHFGAYLVKNKLVRNMELAFFRYLGKGKPFYVPREGLEFEKAARLIHDCGGIAVLAHPKSLHVSWGRLPELLGQLKALGLDGIEAWHPAATVGICKRMQDLGKTLGLLLTAGSDFHGMTRPERKLGLTAGGKKIGSLGIDFDAIMDLSI